MSSKTTIADAGNITVPAYLALIRKGYSVHCDRGTAENNETWYAENDSLRLVAEDPVTLLGIAAMAEVRGVEWKATDQEIDTFLQEFSP